MAKRDEKGTKISVRGLGTGTWHSSSERERGQAQDHSGGKQRAVGRASGGRVSPAIPQRVGVVDRKETRIPERLGRGPAKMAEARLRPVEDRALRPQPLAEIDILEPRGKELLVEASDPFEGFPANSQRRGRCLLAP